MGGEENEDGVEAYATSGGAAAPAGFHVADVDGRDGVF